MKKLLTLALGLILSSTMLNAQFLCGFVYQGDPTTGTYYFSADPASGDSLAYMYQWTFNNGSVVVNGQYAQNQYDQSTVDVVTLTIYSTLDSSIYCSGTQEVVVTVDSSSGNNCPISYQVSPANPNTYIFWVPGANYPATWTFDNGTTTTSGNEVPFTFSEPGYHTICMNITGGGFTCNDCVEIFIPSDSTMTPGCSADFWASTSALVGYYIPTGYNYSNTATYSWNFGDGQSSTEMYPYHEYTTSGNYEVCLTVTDGSCSENSCQPVFIPESNTVPTDSSCYAGFIITQDNPYEVTVVNAATGLDLNFVWTLSSNGISITSEGAFPTMVVDSTGGFVFCLTVSNGNGCEATYCDSILVDANGSIGGRMRSNGFTINVVSPQVLTGYTLGMEESNEVAFSLYPNPFSEVLNLNTAGKEFKSYSIYSVDGKRVQAGSINGTVQTLNTSDLSQGVYVLTLTDAKGNSQVQKVVKK